MTYVCWHPVDLSRQGRAASPLAPSSVPPSCLATAELTCWLCSVSCVPWASSLSCAIKPHLANISVCWIISLTSSYNPWGSISWQSTWEGSAAKALLGMVPCARPLSTWGHSLTWQQLAPYSSQCQFISHCQAQTFRTKSQETQWIVTPVFSCSVTVAHQEVTMDLSLLFHEQFDTSSMASASWKKGFPAVEIPIPWGFFSEEICFFFVLVTQKNIS